MEAKQTAVEWLVNEILMPEYGHLPVWVIDKVDEAKEKEHQQTIDFGKRVADNWGMVDVPIENIEKLLNKK